MSRARATCSHTVWFACYSNAFRLYSNQGKKSVNVQFLHAANLKWILNLPPLSSTSTHFAFATLAWRITTTVPVFSFLLNAPAHYPITWCTLAANWLDVLCFFFISYYFSSFFIMFSAAELEFRIERATGWAWVSGWFVQALPDHFGSGEYSERSHTIFGRAVWVGMCECVCVCELCMANGRSTTICNVWCARILPISN